ncbi:MAG: CARDB domain-containing protein, partial [Candidatus Marinimicrobia bacterium]|nr:CARDB domain-containing protein [Candidatus Neomarinimicrobiota bacterium]
MKELMSIIMNRYITILISLLLFIPLCAQNNEGTIVGKIHIDKKGKVTILPLENTEMNSNIENSNELQKNGTYLETENMQNNAITTSSQILQCDLSDINNPEVIKINSEKEEMNKSLYEKPSPDYNSIPQTKKIIRLLNHNQIDDFKNILKNAEIFFEETHDGTNEFVIEEDGINVLKQNKISYVVIGVEAIGEIINSDNREKLESAIYVPSEDPYVSGTNSADYNIPDKPLNQPYGYVYSPITITGATGVVTKVEYFVMVPHTWPSDLKLYLWNSSHQRLIWDRWGGTTDGGYDDDAADDDDIYLYGRSTTYFNGDNPNRLWTLDAYDYAFLNTGKIDWWILRVYYEEPLPNLTKSGTSTLSGYGDNKISLSTEVINIGAATAGSSHLGYYLSTNTTISQSDYRWADDYVTSLTVGAKSPESSGTVDLTTVSPTIPDGTYYVGWIIDYLNEVIESDENDNNFYFPSPMITVVRKPNLTTYGTPSLSISGNTVSVSNVIIKNTGSKDAGSSTLGYYVSGNNSITTSDYLWETDYVSSLTPGQTSPEDESQDLTSVSSSIPAGTYYVGYFIDKNYEVNESDESDNGYLFPSPQVQIIYKPNLTTQGTPNLSVNGNTVSVSTIIVNNELGNAGSSKLGFYVSNDVSLNTSDYRWDTNYVPSLTSSATSSQSSGSVDLTTVSPTIPSGDYYVGYIIDYEDNVDEKNESDNTYLFTSPKVTIEHKPNLTTSGTPALNINGSEITVNTIIINLGEGEAGSSTL